MSRRIARTAATLAATALVAVGASAAGASAATPSTVHPALVFNCEVEVASATLLGYIYVDQYVTVIAPSPAAAELIAEGEVGASILGSTLVVAANCFAVAP